MTAHLLSSASRSRPTSRRSLLTIELVMLLVLSRHGAGQGRHRAAPAGDRGDTEPLLAAARPTCRFSAFVSGIILMLFIYWGWDTAVSVNEETKDKATTPGPGGDHLDRDPAGHLRARDLLGVQSFAGIGTKGIGLANPAHAVRRAVGPRQRDLRQRRGFGAVLSRLLILMVLTSAAASTQTTILPTARTTLSMAAYKAIPNVVREDPPAVPDADRVHDRRWALVSIALYVPLNYISNGNADRRRGDRDRPLHRLLLRPDRVRLRLVLPQDADQQRSQPVDAGHPARRWAALIMWAAGIYSLQSDWTCDQRLHLLDGARHCTGRSAGSSSSPFLAARGRGCSASSTCGSPGPRSSARRP